MGPSEFREAATEAGMELVKCLPRNSYEVGIKFADTEEIVLVAIVSVYSHDQRIVARTYTASYTKELARLLECLRLRMQQKAQS